MKNPYKGTGLSPAPKMALQTRAQSKKVMLRARTTSFIFMFFLFFSLSNLAILNAQTNSTPQVESILLRPLNDLLDDAIIYSPILKVQSLNVDLLYSDLKVLKKEWANNITLSGSAQVGNVQFIDNLNSGSGEPDVRTISRENIFGVLGLTVRFPLGDFLTKRERQRQIKMKIDQQKLTLEQKKIDIRQLVIRQYNDIQRSIKQVEIRTQDLDFHTVTTEMAERYFREGNMSLDDYTSAFSKNNEARIRLEEAKLDAQLSLLLLRELVGKEITF